MSINTDHNNFWLQNNFKKNLIKEKIISEEKNIRNGISTNETYENTNDNYSDNEIDFNKNFFPLNKKFKLTDILVDKWEDNIKLIYEEVIKDLNKICDK